MRVNNNTPEALTVEYHLTNGKFVGKNVVEAGKSRTWKFSPIFTGREYHLLVRRAREKSINGTFTLAAAQALRVGLKAAAVGGTVAAIATTAKGATKHQTEPTTTRAVQAAMIVGAASAVNGRTGAAEGLMALTGGVMGSSILQPSQAVLARMKEGYTTLCVLLSALGILWLFLKVFGLALVVAGAAIVVPLVLSGAKDMWQTSHSVPKSTTPAETALQCASEAPLCKEVAINEHRPTVVMKQARPLQCSLAPIKSRMVYYNEEVNVDEDENFNLIVR